MKRPVIKDKDGDVVYINTYKFPDSGEMVKVIRGGNGRGPIIKAWLESYGLNAVNKEEAENPNKVMGFVTHPGPLELFIRSVEDMNKHFEFESVEELDIAMSTQPIRDAMGEEMAQGSSLIQLPKPILTQLLALGIKDPKIEETHDGYDIKSRVKNLEILM